ncbi:outer membrane immunogenic protein [Phyllobacterium ifriqiyense]|uniref:Outer membrane immunogenic protein n=1 Tax=Phyllobacterium ifriqiyense TaxID=314238 RepID=A0ABU0S602_9HYPH|nr:outer membrane immunogenic protein [Phyllobacterium ifriqiyense]
MIYLARAVGASDLLALSEVKSEAALCSLECGTLRKILFCSFILIGSSGAMAADVTNSRPPVSEGSFTWSGGYIGIQGGGGWASGDFSGFGINGSEDANGGTLGGFVGYNHQFHNNLVIGIEGDLEYNWNEQQVFGADFGTDWAGSVRGRIGYAFDQALVYAAAGWATTRGYVEVPGLGEDEKAFNGYTVGAGLDYAFSNQIFGRLDYRYSDYGDKDLQGINVDVDQHAVKIGLGVKF